MTQNTHHTANRSRRLGRDGGAHHLHQVRQRVLRHRPVRRAHCALHRNSPPPPARARCASLALSHTERHARHGAQNRRDLRLSHSAARLAAVDSLVLRFSFCSHTAVWFRFGVPPSPSSCWTSVPRFPLPRTPFTPSMLPSPVCRRRRACACWRAWRCLPRESGRTRARRVWRT